VVIGLFAAVVGALLWLFSPLKQWLNDPVGLLGNWLGLGVIIGFILICLILHFLIRNWSAKAVAKSLSSDAGYGDLAKAFLKSTRGWTSIFRTKPVGWSRRVSGKLSAIRNDVDQFVQKLNDNFSRPSGKDS